MTQSKNKFTDKLRYGACGGRKQIHPKANIHPEYCVNENAGTRPSPCLYNPHKAASGPCNCCDECRFCCQQLEIIRHQYGETSKMAVEKIMKDWDKLRKEHGLP